MILWHWNVSQYHNHRRIFKPTALKCFTVSSPPYLQANFTGMRHGIIITTVSSSQLHWNVSQHPHYCRIWTCTSYCIYKVFIMKCTVSLSPYPGHCSRIIIIVFRNHGISANVAVSASPCPGQWRRILFIAFRNHRISANIAYQYYRPLPSVTLSLPPYPDIYMHQNAQVIS